MAPTRKSRSVNKHFSYVNEVSPSKDGEDSKKSMQRKRKLSDMLGSQWSKDELECFYEAYRKHGKDWKKVAAVLRNRSVSMVEALYTMNRAYLSLPEGTASVVGLIAMMTDHYCNLEGSDSDQESNDATVTSRKPQKRARGNTSKGSDGRFLSRSQPVASSSGCLSLLKKRRSGGTRPRAVGKRTPRFPISYSYEKINGEKFFSPTRRGLKLKVDANDDDVAHEVALALAEASQRGGSPQVSQTPNRRTDEGSAFDALQTLADLSLMMPTTATENESSVPVKEEDEGLVDKYGFLESVPTTRQRDKPKSSGVKVKGKLRFEATSLKTSRLGKVSVFNVSAIPEAKDDPEQSTTKTSRKKPKLLGSKIPKTRAHIGNQPNESQEDEIREAGKKLMSKGKRSSYNNSQHKQGKSVRHPENSALNNYPRGEKDDPAPSTVQIPIANQVNLHTKVRSRRKMELQKPQNLRDLKFSDNLVDEQHNLPIPSIHDGASNLKEKLSNCLSNHRARRWCAFEWFYSAVDYPWFAKREFVEYLNHVGLGHVPRLTRVEWGVIRSSLGKPRRFSEQFLREEKEKLNQYRESVRTHYTELRTGTREGLPADLVRPLSVGQRVIAIHPRTRQIHDGNILTVDHTRCRVQFDQPELGVEFVQDIDCMPLKPSENMPTLLERNTVAIDKFFENFSELKMNGQAKDQKPAGNVKFSPGENLEHLDVPSHMSPATYSLSNMLKQAKGVPTNFNSQAKIGSKETANNREAANSQSSTLAQIQAKEADVQALAELTRVLDKKEAVVSELRHMNDDVLENQRDGDNDLKDSEPFKKQYAAVLVQLNEVNEQVSSALCCLRQRNTYLENSPFTWSRSNANLGDSGGSLSSLDQSANHMQESESHVHEIVESSRIKARTVVDAAMQAMSSLKGGRNTVERIEEAIDYVSNQLSLDDPCMMPMRSSTPADPIHGGSASQDQLTSCTLSSLHAPELKLKTEADRNEAQIPSELISHCVSTLFMIQKCTERQFPPADVARMLDSAVTGLQPCCSQNRPIYAEIQKCMGIIRNQILALVPT